MKVKSLVVAGCLMMCMICPAVFAQDDYSKFDIFAGYSFMRTAEYDNVDLVKETLANELWFEQGFNANFKKSNFLERGFSTSLTYNLTSALGLETSFRYNSGYILSASERDQYFDMSLGTVETNYEEGFKKKRIALLFGPRITLRNVFGNSVNPFVYGLVGLSHDRLSYSYDLRVDYFHFNDTDRRSESETVKNHNSFGIALGGGLDIPVHPNVAIRAIQADYFMAKHPGDISDASDFKNKRFDNVTLSFGIVGRFGNGR